MYKVILSVLIVFLFRMDADGQAMLKKMANGLNNPIVCTCADSSGGVYAITAPTNDSIDIFHYNGFTWQLSGSLGKVYTSLNLVGSLYSSQRGSCAYINGALYFTANFSTFESPKIYNRCFLYRFTGNSWTKMFEFKGNNYTFVRTLKFNNKLYFFGNMDSIGFQKMNDVVVLDSGVFKATSFPDSPNFAANLDNFYFETSADTLFVASGKKVYYLKLPNEWGIYYTSPYSVTGIALSKPYFYVGSGNGISILKNKLKYDSLSLTNPNSSSFSTNHMLAYKDIVMLKDQTTIYTIKHGKDLQPVFKLSGIDTSKENVFLKFNNSGLYYQSPDGLKYNGINYNSIAEIVTDSLKPKKYDTVYIYIFRDKNRNYKFDGKDLKSASCNIEVNGVLHQADTNGSFIYYPLENEAVIVYFKNELNPDSCYKTSFSAALASKTFNSPRIKDTLNLTLWKASAQNRNLVIRSWGNFKERIGDVSPLTIKVNSRDCDNSTSSASVRVVLDTNTLVVSSYPPYTSKTGNILMYNLSNILPGNQGTSIRLNVTYPVGKYRLGQKVRHFAMLSTTFAEDTMDNLDSIVQVMVYSYDPNAKFSIPEGRITKDLKSIRYRIDFQNEGTDVARTVTVIDTLNLKMPVYEFQMVDASHLYDVSLKGNVVTWVFNNINLLPKSTSEKESKGYIIFDARVRSSIRTGDSIQNKASIYFDYNEPVETNYTVVKRVGDDKDIKDKSIGNTVKVFPNPGKLQITLQNLSNQTQFLIIYDSKGSRVMSVMLNSLETKTVSTESWAMGMYIILNEHGKGLKIIIE